MSGKKYCPWGTNLEPCTKNCALWLESACAFVWIAKEAQEKLLEIERQEFMALYKSRLQGK